jgi:hypothetical protein
MNRVTWASIAIQQLRKLNKPDQNTIYDAVSELATMPDSRNVKALTTTSSNIGCAWGTTGYSLTLTGPCTLSRSRK